MQDDEVILIDVRRPTEWADSGVAVGAHPVTVQDPDFLTKVTEVTGGDTSAELAFICRSGGRSATARDQLIDAGYSSVTSVVGGTLMDGG